MGLNPGMKLGSNSERKSSENAAVVKGGLSLSERQSRNEGISERLSNAVRSAIRWETNQMDLPRRSCKKRIVSPKTSAPKIDTT